MAKRFPILRLPFWLADNAFVLSWVFARDPKVSCARAWSYLPRFELSGPEQLFAKSLLRKKRNLWLFRCDQKSYCGDFAVVDMSSPQVEGRKLYVLELKAGAPLRFAGKGAEGQLRNSELVAEHIRELGLAMEITDLVSGGEEAVLSWFGVEPR